MSNNDNNKKIFSFLLILSKRKENSHGFNTFLYLIRYQKKDFFPSNSFHVPFFQRQSEKRTN